MRILISHLSILVLIKVSALAQSPGVSTVSGTVVDPQGAVVPSAQLTLREPATGVQRLTSSNEAGRYLFTNVFPGTYEIRVEAAGFKTAVAAGVKVEVGTAVSQHFSLQIGRLETTVAVVASGERPLETTDSSLGNVIRVEVIKRLPNLVRDAGQLMSLQPGVTPLAEITGARRDQSTFLLDGIDVSDNYSGSGLRPFRAVVPLPTESVEELRVVVANPSAAFGRGAGAQIALQTKRGTNLWHGSSYWYHRNDALNANSWTSNRLGQPRPVERDHRFGITSGAPVRRDTTFFFAHFEGRHRKVPARITRIVPTESMRQGLLRFRDASGTERIVNPRDFDPRGMGASPAILRFLRLYPEGNDPSVQGADGLNTTGFSIDLPATIRDDFGLLRLDHTFSRRWVFDGSARLSRSIQVSPGQVDLINKRLISVQSGHPRSVSGALNGFLTPRLSIRFQFGWTTDRFADERSPPLAVPPFNVALDLALGRLDEPVDVAPTIRVSGRGFKAHHYQWSNHLDWHRGSHLLQSGVRLRRIDSFSFRDDRAFSSLSTPVAVLSGGQFNVIPASQRPGYLRPADIGAYDALYSALLGIVESVSASGVLDGGLRPLPLGTRLSTAHRMRAWEFYLQDTWRLRPSLALNIGLSYGWQTAPVEHDGRQTIALETGSGRPVLPQDYLRRKRDGAQAGRIFNPELAFLPVRNAQRSTVFDTDRNDWSPRISAAWNPSCGRGFLGKLLGPGRTVLRAGYGLLFDRTNSILVTLVPSLGVGFSQSVQLDPRNSQGEKHRVVVDGPVPLPALSPATVPFLPRDELISVSLDPALRTPRHHAVNFTVQRELPGGLVLELAYVGRLARGLYQVVNLNNSPFMFRDPVSGQTFAQAFDSLAGELRSGVPAASVTPQPWFESFLPGRGTRFLAADQTSNLVTGNLNALFQFALDPLAGQPFNNRQVRDLMFVTSLGRSNYHGAIFTLTKRTSHGLHFDFSYTFSRSLDQIGLPQILPQRLPNSFDPDTDYGASVFDRTHMVNALWIYDLPIPGGRGGRGRRLSSGWYLSGIFTASSGIPLGVAQSTQAYGGGLQTAGFFSIATAAVPVERAKYPNDPHRSAGSGGVGVAAGGGGSGLNYFADPQAAFRSFRHVLLARDTRSGRGALRGFPSWNLDIALGKMTRLSEHVKIGFSFELFNVFNHVVFANPSLSLSEPQSFGVISTQGNSPRLVQAGLRLEW